MTSFNLNYLRKTPSPGTVILRVRVIIYAFWGDTIQSRAKIINKNHLPRLLYQERLGYALVTHLRVTYDIKGSLSGYLPEI